MKNYKLILKLSFTYEVCWIIQSAKTPRRPSNSCADGFPLGQLEN